MDNGTHWIAEHIEEANSARSFRDLGVVAVKEMLRLPKGKLGQVCGPISTGGLGCIEKNLEVFGRTIQTLKGEGVRIFDQMPLEVPIRNIRTEDVGDYQRILDEIYLPLFETGRLSHLYFIHDWESSMGARWEREQAKRLGIAIEDLPKGYVRL